MTLMRMFFSGQIKKAEHREAGGKPLVEVSLCKKHKGRNGAEDSYTWARLTIWEPAEFQVPRLVKGSIISGSGDVQLRSYVAKDGTKAHSLELRCTSYDIEVEEGADTTAIVRTTALGTHPNSGAIAHHANKPYDSQAQRAGSAPADDVPFRKLSEHE